MSIQIETMEAWRKLRDEGLTTIVDPMVFRCGEIFLKGAGQATNPDESWKLLEANLHAVGMFFDRLILDEKLPVFNYGDTFDAILNFDERVLTRINDYDEQILFDVDVEYDAYHTVKTAALAELAKVVEGPHKIQPQLGNEIVGELAAAEYRWSPSLEILAASLANDEEKQVAAFFLGGLIFSGYAAQVEGEHVLQPKRSRLFLAVSLGFDSVGYQLEEHLFAALKERAHARCDDLPWRPSFFPYLLSIAESPTRALEEVVLLRRSPEVVDYRAWMDEAILDLKRDGRITTEKKNDVRAILSGIDRLTGSVSLPQVKVGTTVADVAAAKSPGVSLDFTPVLKDLWGWVLDSLPGNRYRKLLTRAVVTDREFVTLENRVKTVWRAG